MNEEYTASAAADIEHEFITFALKCNALKFGKFETKAGRISPYFFNAGFFNDGEKLAQLAQFYAQRVVASGVQFDMIFGPAYKGIPLVSAVAIELSRLGRNVPFSFNRKEVKDHGEGGILVGAPLAGRVLIIDDVISAGTATRESVNIIRTAGATPKAVLILLDRQEKAKVKGEDVPYSATQFVSKEFGLEVHAVAKLDDLLGFLEQQSDPEFKAQYAAVRAYRALYGVDE